MAIDPAVDPRGARWEQRLHVPVLVAAWGSIPVVALYFSKLGPTLAVIALALSWLVWFVFFVEAVAMLTQTKDPRAWARTHALGLAILLLTFPLLVQALQELLAARALSGVAGLRALQVLYLAKAAKLLKALLVLRRKGAGPRHPVALVLAALLIVALGVGIVERIVTGDKDPTPLHGTYEVLVSLPWWALAVSGALVVALAVRLATARSAPR